MGKAILIAALIWVSFASGVAAAVLSSGYGSRLASNIRHLLRNYKNVEHRTSKSDIKLRNKINY